MTRKAFWIIFTIAAALRLLAINMAPLWYDENFTLILARLPFERMIAATAGDVHPPLWYLLEWSIYHLAPDLPAWIIRLPSLTFSLLALYVFDQLCGDMRIPPRVRVLSFALMAVLPFQIWYAQEGRMYAMLEFLVLFTLLTGTRRQWIAFTLSSIAMLYTQNYALFYLGIICVVLMVLDIESTAQVITAGLISALAYAPWAMVVMEQMSAIEGRYWIMDAGPGAVLNAIYKQFWASSMLEQGVITSHVVTFALLIIGVWSLLGEKIKAWWVVLTMAFAPVAVAWLASIFWQPVILFRPLIGVSPFLYLIVAWPVASVSPYKAMGSRALYVSCFALPLLMLGIGGYFQNIPAMKNEGAVSPMLDALAYIRANWQAGDVLYYADDGPMVSLMPYVDETMPQYKLPACDERIGYAPVLGSLSDQTRKAFGIPSVNLSDVDYRRAWVLAPRSPLHPLCYEAQIKDIAPAGKQIITVDDNEYITSGVWLVEK